MHLINLGKAANKMTQAPDLKQNIACIEVSSTALGYRILDQVSKFNGVRIIEASPIGGGNFWILAAGDRSTFASFQNLIKASIETVGKKIVALMVDYEILELKDGLILEALYSLSAERLQEALLIVECDSVSGLLSSVQAIQEQHQLKLIEIKVSRGARTGAHAFLTGGLADCQLNAKIIRTNLNAKSRQGFVEVVEAPNDIFRKQFNFSGEV